MWVESIQYLNFSLGIYLRHGLRTPNEALFSSKYQTFGFGQTIWEGKFWNIWGTFGRFISTHFGTVSPLSMFSISQLAIVCP